MPSLRRKSVQGDNGPQQHFDKSCFLTEGSFPQVGSVYCCPKLVLSEITLVNLSLIWQGANTVLTN